MRALDPRLLREAPSARRFLVAAAVLAACSAAATIAQAVLLATVVVDAFLHGRSANSLVPQLVALGVLALVRGAIAWALESGGRLAALRVARELRGRVLAHVVRARPGTVPTAEVATAVTEGVRALEPYFARFLPQLLLAALTPPAILVWVALHDPISAVVMATTLPLIPVFGALIGMTAEARTRARWAALARMSAHFLDVVQGLTTLRAFRRGQAQAKMIAATSDAYRRETMATLRVAFLSALVLELAATLGTAVVAVEIGVRLVNGSVALQPALVALVLAPELYGPLRQTAAQFHTSADGLAAAARLFALLDLEPAARPPARPLPAQFGVVRLEEVTAAYDGRGIVLGALSLTLQPGERLALVGPSGAGKTTLLALLLRFIDPNAGSITVGGNDLRELDLEQWRRLVAWLPQRPRLEPGPVVEVIRCGDAGSEDVTAAAESAGAAMLLGRILDEGGGGISAGELRRVALARALARDAPLLLLDEPTAHLDAAGSAVVARAVERLPRSRTLLLVSHDPRLLMAVDRVLVLADGRLRERAREAV